ncbi:hypothetical protein VN12_25175 [Pirellula sp. SH-Sr6A]|nr:hypothetical protein VN12_25175 [Pirellula sp. SH-Sr6A]
MAFGPRKSVQQQDLFIAGQDLGRSDGRVFYAKLNRLLDEAGFDPWIEKLCGPYYNQSHGRPRIPPAVYYRMLLVGYFEGIQSQHGIAWRCADQFVDSSVPWAQVDRPLPGSFLVDHYSRTLARHGSRIGFRMGIGVGLREEASRRQDRSCRLDDARSPCCYEGHHLS